MQTQKCGLMRYHEVYTHPGGHQAIKAPVILRMEHNKCLNQIVDIAEIQDDNQVFQKITFVQKPKKCNSTWRRSSISKLNLSYVSLDVNL